MDGLRGSEAGREWLQDPGKASRRGSSEGPAPREMVCSLRHVTQTKLVIKPALHARLSSTLCITSLLAPFAGSRQAGWWPQAGRPARCQDADCHSRSSRIRKFDAEEP